MACLALALWMTTRMAGDIFLKEWTKHPSDVSFYLPIYVALRLGGCIFIFLRSFILSVIMSPIISKNAHSKLMEAFLKAPINLFYDVTPLGRLLNRLTKDINMIDDEISFTVGSVLANVCSTASCILMGLIYFPYLMVVVPLILVPGRLISRYYMKTSRELTRLESISRSPMLNHFTETLAGAKFIRCFKQVENFIIQNQLKINENMKLNYSKCGCEQWMRLYLGLLSALFLSALFIAAIVFRNDISVGIVGLTLTYMIPLPDSLNELLVSLTSIENEMVSVERVKAFTDLPKERELVTVKDQNHLGWPESPSISFNKVFMRYRPNTDLVLKGLSLNIPGGLRVGITGRTGSGKSSLFLGLLRIVEIESGLITIDGVNTALLGLKKLREAITLIPQDPLVFNGTMKENLDPFSLFDEKTIEKVLKEVGLKFALDYEVKNSGKNISIGERQLLSLSRALISNTKIILFDEATAGIDPENDRKIQEVIKGKFTGCTILTIAHRLATIVESDLVVLLADGKVLEMGKPSELLSKDSEFKSLASKMH
jgi:ABC-type multidrug transport system fused ATPase/permease subunit